MGDRVKSHESIGTSGGETGAVDIKETRIEPVGPVDSVAAPEEDAEAIRERERAAENPDDPDDPND